MIKAKNDRPGTPIEIDLTGPNGNAFYLLGLAENLGKQLGYDKLKRERISMEMTLADYECLLQTFDREFGLLVTLWR
jgi:hypothetical protein|tara:strand:+ start:2299 stop:2529 length:231 start_codon:yes stop_codon:yes gene_type:complete